MTQLTYSEAETAEIIGVDARLLREAREAGKIAGIRVGQRWRYTVWSIAEYLGTTPDEVVKVREAASATEA